MPDARNLPGCSAAGSPAARGAEGGRRPAARRCPSMGSPESSGGGGPCAERGGARSLGHPSSACRLPGVSRIAVGVRRRVLPLPPAAPPFLCFLFCFFFLLLLLLLLPPKIRRFSRTRRPSVPWRGAGCQPPARCCLRGESGRR